MQTIDVPLLKNLTAENQLILKTMEKTIGFIPNLYATMAHSVHGLRNYEQFEKGKHSLTLKEVEVINLVTSQINYCAYCLSAFTLIGKLNGFSDSDMNEIRKGYFSADSKLDALAKLVLDIVLYKGKMTDDTILPNFFTAGFTKENLIDTVNLIGLRCISNYLHNMTEVPLDFPPAPELK